MGGWVILGLWKILHLSSMLSMYKQALGIKFFSPCPKLINASHFENHLNSHVVKYPNFSYHIALRPPYFGNVPTMGMLYTT